MSVYQKLKNHHYRIEGRYRRVNSLARVDFAIEAYEKEIVSHLCAQEIELLGKELATIIKDAAERSD